jgi:hypothetical protein
LASNPAHGSGGLQGLATRWNDLAKPWRVNVALYALTALSLIALVFELVAGGDTPATVDLASQVPVTTSSTVAPSTTRPSTTTSSSTSSTSTTRPVTVTTRRSVVITEPEPEPEPEVTTTSVVTEDTTTIPVEETTTTVPVDDTTTTTVASQAESTTTAPPSA